MQRIGRKTSITVPDEILAKIDDIAKYHDIYTADAHRILLDLGLKIYEDHEKIKVSRLVEIVKKAKKDYRRELTLKL